MCGCHPVQRGSPECLMTSTLMGGIKVRILQILFVMLEAMFSVASLWPWLPLLHGGTLMPPQRTAGGLVGGCCAR